MKAKLLLPQPLLLTIVATLLSFQTSFGQMAWNEVGGGADNVVTSMLEYGGELYIGGKFVTTGSSSIPYLCRWNGSGWSSFGLGVNGEVKAMTIYNGELHIGGNFTTAGGTIVNHVAKWDGSTWSALGAGITGPGFGEYAVAALEVHDGELYVGGAFTGAGGIPLKNIARWDGSSWDSVGTGLSAFVKMSRFPDIMGSGGGGSPTVKGSPTIWALASYKGELYAGGIYLGSPGSGMDHMAKWNGSSWSDAGGGVNWRVYALEVSNDKLYVGGAFGLAGGMPAMGLASWDSTSWSFVSSGVTYFGSGGTVFSLDDQNGNLLVGGNFDVAGGVSTNHIAKWDGSAFTAIGSGTSYDVHALSLYNGDLHAGGNFSTAGILPAANIATWVMATGIDNELNLDANIMVYPNPFTESTHVIIPNPGVDAEELRIEIFDSVGKKVQISTRKEINGISIHRNGLSAGMYYLQVKSGGNIIYHNKLMIE